MGLKFAIIYTCIALSCANYIPVPAVAEEGVQAGEFVFFADEDLANLRQPRDVRLVKLDPPTIGHKPGSKINFIPKEEVVREPPRQINIQGGGSPGKGFDVSAQGRVKLWESENKMNSIHGTASYSQHLGGPYGNSRPNVGGV